MARILILDIENAPSLGYFWGVWKQNIGHNQVKNYSYMMSFAAKWLGEDSVIYEETRTEDDSKIVNRMLELLDEADIIIAHNGDKFDIPKINAYAIKNNLKPPSPYKTIDTLKIAKSHFRFERNTLQYVADVLGCSPKITHQKYPGFELWSACMKGDPEAWNEMKAYNIQDVYTLEEVYLKLRPWYKNHPNVAVYDESDKYHCPKCNSTSVQRRGFTTTNVSKYQKYSCNDCGGWSRTRYSEYPKEVRKELLTNA